MRADPESRPGVAALSRLYGSGDISPVEAVRAVLARIERFDPALNAYLAVEGDRALAQASRAETEIRAGRKRGPLHGIPYAAKDLFDTRGIRTTVGSKIMASNVPARDAAAIERLEAAGAILVGKTGLHEWAYGITSTNPHFGPVRNPWDPARIPGGSSGGSAAAQAAGLCAFSLGSDTGGSIRIPAALCGVAGLKPTFGRVSRRGAYPLGHTLDTVGHFAGSVEDVSLVYAALAGRDPGDPVSSGAPVRVPALGAEPRLDGTVIGVPASFYFQRLAPDVDVAARAALDVLEGLGADLREVEVPDIESANSLHRLILLAEAASVHRRRLESRREDFGADVRSLLEQGLFVPATDYLEAQRSRRRFCQAFDAAFRKIDILVAPAVPIPTARVGELEIDVGGRRENVRLATTRNVRALNLTGLPVLTVPCGFHRDGLPIGLQFVGPRYGEDRILAAGHAYERAADWSDRMPPTPAEAATGSGPA